MSGNVDVHWTVTNQGKLASFSQYVSFIEPTHLFTFEHFHAFMPDPWTQDPPGLKEPANPWQKRTAYRTSPPEMPIFSGQRTEIDALLVSSACDCDRAGHFRRVLERSKSRYG